MGISDELLMAYADGELTAAQAAEVERAMALDEALAERAALFADSRAAAKRAFAPAPAVSAAVALAVGAGTVWLAAGDARSVAGRSGGGLEVAGLQDPAISAALGLLPSGERSDLGDGASLSAIATFKDGAGALCREFEHDRAGGATVVAVACRMDGAWDIRFAIAAAGAASDGYAPASSLETLDAFLTATEAGAPLSAADEAAALGAID